MKANDLIQFNQETGDLTFRRFDVERVDRLKKSLNVAMMEVGMSERADGCKDYKLALFELSELLGDLLSIEQAAIPKV